MKADQKKLLKLPKGRYAAVNISHKIMFISKSKSVKARLDVIKRDIVCMQLLIIVILYMSVHSDMSLCNEF